jgi:hypothetical protein
MLDPINYILRDPRNGDIYPMDPRLMDFLYIYLDRIIRKILF